MMIYEVYQSSDLGESTHSSIYQPSIIFFITFHNTLYPVLTQSFRGMVHAWDFQARCRLALQEAETGWAEKRFASEQQPRNTVELSFHFLIQ